MWDFSSTAATLDSTSYTLDGTTPTPPPAAPVITSGNAIGRVGQSFSYQITGTNNPTHYNASGLPAGLNVNEATGLISGVPTVAGTYTPTIAADNAGGTGTAWPTFTINTASLALGAASRTKRAFVFAHCFGLR